jgi:hypothetical protein
VPGRAVVEHVSFGALMAEPGARDGVGAFVERRRVSRTLRLDLTYPARSYHDVRPVSLAWPAGSLPKLWHALGELWPGVGPSSHRLRCADSDGDLVTVATAAEFEHLAALAERAYALRTADLALALVIDVKTASALVPVLDLQQLRCTPPPARAPSPRELPPAPAAPAVKSDRAHVAPVAVDEEHHPGWQGPGWMDTTDEAGGFRELFHFPGVRLAVSKAPTMPAAGLEVIYI